MAEKKRAKTSGLLTLARDLKRRKARDRRALFVAEGVRTVEELVRSRLAIDGALVTKSLRETPRGRVLVSAIASKGIRCDEVSDTEFASAAGTDHPQGILAIAEAPSHTLDALGGDALARILVLDAIQDPGNVGTLVRTAAALGAGAVVALPGTADLWNAKAVRSAAGAHFRIPTVSPTVAELVAFLTSRDVTLWGLSADGSPLAGAKAPARLALAVGNEGAGLSAPVRAATYLKVAIPMAPGAESLNVAVAAGIALHALRP